MSTAARLAEAAARPLRLIWLRLRLVWASRSPMIIIMPQSNQVVLSDVLAVLYQVVLFQSSAVHNFGVALWITFVVQDLRSQYM